MPFVLDRLLAEPFCLLELRLQLGIWACGLLSGIFHLHSMRNLNPVRKRIVVLVLLRFSFINLGPRVDKLDLFDGAPYRTLIATTAIFHPAETASKRIHALDWVFRSRRVRDTERAILPFTVVRWSVPRVPMARLAKVV